jgi:four helix bundle protein
VGHFKKLKAWQHARSLTILSQGAIRRLPAAEQDALAAQWKRACYSVVLNVAEGASRRGSRGFRRHLVIARASLDEIEAILDLVVGLGSFRPEELAKIEAIRDECAKTIFGLIRKVSTSTAPSGTGGV